MDILTDVEALNTDLASLTAAVEELEEEIIGERAAALDAIEKYEDAERDLKKREGELEAADEKIADLERQLDERNEEAWEAADKLTQAVEDYLLNLGYPRRPMLVPDRDLQALINAVFE